MHNPNSYNAPRSYESAKRMSEVQEAQDKMLRTAALPDMPATRTAM